MRETDDALDIVMVVVALIMMMSVCAWAVTYIRASSSVDVAEKTSISTVYTQAVVKPVKTAEDALLSLVVNDEYVPDPTTVVFQLGRETYTVVFDNAYFKDKEVSINKAWEEFFHDKMDTTIESITLDPSGTRWIVKLTK